MLNMILPPHDDEHITSWFLRMAYQHGLNIKSFNSLCGNTPCRNTSYKYDCLGTDYYGGILHEIDKYHDAGNCGSTGLDLFKQTSLYTGVRALLTEPLQDSFIQGVFDPNVDRKYVNHVGKLMVCPDCAMEESYQHRGPIYHRAHHMPGVKACWEHGTKLIPVSTRDVRAFISRTTAPPYRAEMAPINDIEYALFAKQFMDQAYDCSKEDMVYVIRKLYSDTTLTGLTAREEKALQWIRCNYNCSPEMMLRILFLYTKAGIDVDAVIREHIGLDAVRMQMIKADSRYSIVDYSNTIIQAVENETGKRFITTPSLLVKKDPLSHMRVGLL